MENNNRKKIIKVSGFTSEEAGIALRSIQNAIRSTPFAQSILNDYLQKEQDEEEQLMQGQSELSDKERADQIRKAVDSLNSIVSQAVGDGIVVNISLRSIVPNGDLLNRDAYIPVVSVQSISRSL